jgi:hypothetical protein
VGDPVTEEEELLFPYHCTIIVGSLSVQDALNASAAIASVGTSFSMTPGCWYSNPGTPNALNWALADLRVTENDHDLVQAAYDNPGWGNCHLFWGENSAATAIAAMGIVPWDPGV